MQSAAQIPGLSDPLADLYAQRCLDCVIELVSAVGHDLGERPARYRLLSEAVGERLVALRTATGSQPDWPDATERATLAGRRLGQALCGFGATTRRAALTYLLHGTDLSAEPLRRTFEEATQAFRAQRRQLDESQTAGLARRTGKVLTSATEILLSEDLARVMGAPAVPPGEWPDGGLYSLEAAHLCALISERVARPRPNLALTVRKFSVLQRVAYHGASTIDGLFGDHRPGDDVIESAYRWTVALQDLLAGFDQIRAWTDPSYRRALEVAERDILPAHPAGDIALTGSALDPASVAGAVRAGFDTLTVNDEVCCCSGDFCGGSDYCGVTDTGFTCQTSSSCLCVPA